MDTHKTIMEAGKKTLDRVEQAEPQVDHIIIVVIAVFTYRLYRVLACMQELWDVGIELWCYSVLSQFKSYVKVEDLHVLQETMMDMLLIPGLL